MKTQMYSKLATDTSLLVSYSAESNATNKSRLEILQARESHLNDLFEEARNKLATLAEKDTKKYGTLLADLITQGLLQLLEEKVQVIARQKDAELVKSSVEEAKKKFKDISGRSVEIQVKHDLKKDSSGGVVLYGHGGRIKIDNTLDARLKLLEEQVSTRDGGGVDCLSRLADDCLLFAQMLPEIRLDLFGPNPNRKFTT